MTSKRGDRLPLVTAMLGLPLELIDSGLGRFTGKLQEPVLM